METEKKEIVFVPGSDNFPETNSVTGECPAALPGNMLLEIDDDKINPSDLKYW